MPLYEYKCTKCGFIFEVLQSVNDMPLKRCIKCGGAVAKVISPSALQFKGSGWYVTDYAQKKKPDKEKKDKKKPGCQKENASKNSSHPKITE